MIVSLDARLVYDKLRRGIGKTVIALYGSMAELKPDWKFLMFYRDGRFDDPFTSLDNVIAKKIDIRGDRFDLWGKLRLPAGILASRANLYHAVAGMAPRGIFTPMVTTIYDLIPIDRPSPSPTDIAWGENLKRTAHKSARILTASDHAKQRIVELFQIPPEKITVVSWGATSINPEPVEPDTVATVRQRLGVTAGCQYVLHFGLPSAHKNTTRVIDAWAMLPNEVRRGWELLIVGLPDESIPPFQEQVNSKNLSDIRLNGFQTEEDVRTSIAGAGLLCYPTLYEGFGLPVLDGFAAKVPVLSSNTTSIPEVAGDAALLVDPHSTEAVADGLQQLMQDEQLRNELIKRGSERVKQFTWKRTAEEVARVYEEISG